MKKAFTLIELLVVIAIIAILAAILFPVFAQAKLAAKQTSALSNTKQTALGVLMYTTDSDDVFPYACNNSWWYPTDGSWVLSTQPYIKNLPLLRDPVDPSSQASWPTWMQGSSNNTGIVEVSIVANGIMVYANNNWNMYGYMGFINQGTWYAGNQTTNETVVTQPSASIMMTDRFNSADIWGPTSFIFGQNWDDYTGFAGNIPDGSRALNTPYVIPNGSGSGTYTVNQDQRNGAVAVGYAGGTRSVFTFGDGHSKSLNPIQTNPNPNTQPQNNMWNCYR